MVVQQIVKTGVWRVHIPGRDPFETRGGSRKEMEKQYPGASLEIRQVLETQAVTR